MVKKSERRPAAIRRKKRRTLLLSIVGGTALLAAIGLFWFFNQSAPDEVSIESAAAGAAGGQSDSGNATVVDDVEGTWTVDTSVGEFSFEDATSSFVGFRIQEVLARVGASTAVGRTGEITGSITIEGTSVTETIITADLTEIVTNASRRNRAVQSALNTDRFPIATFTLTSPIEIGTIPGDGEVLSATMSGTLELNGVVRPIDIPFEAQIVGELIVLVGSANIVFLDWGIEIPGSPAVMSVEDTGILEIQLFLTQG